MGRAGAAGLRAVLWWSSETLNVQPRQAPFAHHRGQVGEVGYGPQRMFINSWSGRVVEHQMRSLGRFSTSIT